MLNDYEKNMNYSIHVEEEGYWFSLDRTSSGYLVTWGDYVGQWEAKGFLTLMTALSWLALLAADGLEGERKPLFTHWAQLMKEHGDANTTN